MLATSAEELPEITLLGQQERLKGRPRLCSDCGVCASTLRPHMAQSCAFVHNQSQQIEQRLHGRTRQNGDELLFGIYREMYAARMAQPVPHAQWSGMITTLAAHLLATGKVDGVVTTRTVPGTRFAPQPFLARTPAEVLASAGNKPCISPGLRVLDELRASDIRRVAVIGVGCQVHALRALEHTLGLERLYVIGLPCSDSTTYPDQQHFLSLISRSPETVVHYEFMQDFRVWMRHENGQVEKFNYIDIPMDQLGDVFPAACLSCFDYANTLTDITIGYMGAPLGWQWVLVRTDQGKDLFDLLTPALEFTDLTAHGNRQAGVSRYINILTNPPGRPPAPIRKLIAFLQRWRGAKGLEFARTITEMKTLRNLHYVRNNVPHVERRVVPAYVYAALAPYANAYEAASGRSLEPQSGGYFQHYADEQPHCGNEPDQTAMQEPGSG
jgi:coenzyme F420 hydrogenase subunit beta